MKGTQHHPLHPSNFSKISNKYLRVLLNSQVVFFFSKNSILSNGIVEDF